MRLLKKDIFQKIVIDQKVTPSSPEFEKSVVTLLKNEIAKECNLHRVSADTFTKIADDAKKFKSKLKLLFQKPKVQKYNNRSQSFTSLTIYIFKDIST